MSVGLVSFPRVGQGIVSFLVLIVLAYWVHRESHNIRTLTTIVHHYHHENDNFLSHFSQILIELSFAFWLLPLSYFWPEATTHYVEPWSVLLFALFYSSVHNWNYGQCHVNGVHRLHHINIQTNIGPDICDVAFGTKHPDDHVVENTHHYIPNVVLMATLVLLLKCACQTWPQFARASLQVAWLAGIGTYVFLAMLSLVLLCTYTPRM